MVGLAAAVASCSDVPAPYELNFDPTAAYTMPYKNASLQNNFNTITVNGIAWSLGSTYAKASGYNADDKSYTATEAWLVSPAINTTTTENAAYLSVDYVVRYGSKEEADLKANHRILASTDYAGDVTKATWTDLGFTPEQASDWTFKTKEIALPEGLVNKERVVFAFVYKSGDKQYALPKDHDTIALLYNKAIFDKYGVDYPTDDWTWEDLIEAETKITEAGKDDGVYGMAMNTSNNQDGWYNVVYDYGANIVGEDHKSTTIGSDAGKAGMDVVRRIVENGAPQTVVAETGTDSLFNSGLVGMITQGSWMINVFYTADHAADYAWALLPYADVNGNGACDEGERQSCYNGLGWAIAHDVEDPQACYDLISYFCSEKGQKEQAQKGVTMAGMKSVSDEFASAFEGMDVSAFTRIEEEGTLYFRPYTRNTTVWEDALQQGGCFLDAWQNPSDPAVMATACDNAQQIIENAIANE